MKLGWMLGLSSGAGVGLSGDPGQRTRIFSLWDFRKTLVLNPERVSLVKGASLQWERPSRGGDEEGVFAVLKALRGVGGAATGLAWLHLVPHAWDPGFYRMEYGLDSDDDSDDDEVDGEVDDEAANDRGTAFLMGLAPHMSLDLRCETFEDAYYVLNDDGGKSLQISLEKLYGLFIATSLRAIRLQSFCNLDHAPRDASRAGTSSIMALSLPHTSHYGGKHALNAIAEILTWPKALESFAISSSSSSEYLGNNPLSAQQILGALVPQKESLREVFIGGKWNSSSFAPGVGITFRDFPNLRRLGISRHMLGFCKKNGETGEIGKQKQDMTPLAESWNLLPPNLEELQLDLAHERIDYEKSLSSSANEREGNSDSVQRQRRRNDFRNCLCDLAEHKSHGFPKLWRVVLWDRRQGFRYETTEGEIQVEDLVKEMKEWLRSTGLRKAFHEKGIRMDCTVEAESLLFGKV